MTLLNRTLLKMLEEGTLSIIPLDKGQVQPASVDMCPGDTFSIVEDLSTRIITLKDEVRYKIINIDACILLSGQSVLATTTGYVSLPDNLTAFVEGRGSPGCPSLFIQNAGRVDPGFQGETTLEPLSANRCAIELRTGRRVDQLVSARVDDIAMKPYNGRYQEQRGATGPWVYMGR